ncbi:hypothetical protein GALMADRAFT_283213 [Galerina marginata CBS 339.88]|uniref:MYND-type domain-containing protein n=1 Tax=Galerina marginata (strain CBS 339.88) TaxID=685588 RepID=A0A067SMW3_GALM3|nr:hypothetical protein GALMADRAFT_283213 [Galerina marginata CBS 339.88]
MDHLIGDIPSDRCFYLPKDIDHDPNSPTFQFEAVCWGLGNLPPSKLFFCFTCDKTPEGDKEYQRCAKCKSITYCSRECQKRDWPRHKRGCFAVSAQRNFVFKCFQRINVDENFIASLKLDLIDQFGDSLTQNSRAMRVFSVNFFILPTNSEDLNALISPDIPISALLDKPMVGELAVSGFRDISDHYKFPVEDGVRQMWQIFRNNLDRLKLQDTLAIAIEFKYLGSRFYVATSGLRSVPRVETNKRRARAKKGRHIYLPRRTNRLLHEFKDSKGGAMRCLLGDEDKKFSRSEWNV